MNPLTLTSGIALIIAVFCWIKKPFGIPFSITGFIFLAINAIAGVPITTAFSGYTSTGFWTLVPALFFGFALASTGLGKRIAYVLLKRLKNPTLPKLIVIFFIVGMILSLLTPSMVVRVVIIIPIALSCAQLCGFGKGTKERSILLISVWFAAVVPGNAWPNGSLNGPIYTGMFASSGLGEISFTPWVQAALLPIFLTVILTLIFGFLVNRSKEKTTLDVTNFQSAFSDIGPISRSEIATGIILIICFALFVTRELHHIPDAVVCVAGLIALFIFGVIKTKDLGPGISWDFALFMGGALGYGAIFDYTGLSKWLVGIISPAVAPVAGNSVGLFLILALIVMFLWRFVDIATFVPTAAIVIAMIPGFSKEFGINPYVWIPILILAQNTFLMSYTNMFALVAEENMGDAGWDKKTFSKYSFVYCGAAIVAVAVALPYWTGQGLI
ncbi:MAG: SLC13 family permease [Clostridiales bacterium]|nr:SLC13 family permease [Clostridiales bacterium]